MLIVLAEAAVKRLNPFEVREVLQAILGLRWFGLVVSIPLKSGRCCKGALQNYLFKIKELFVKLR